LAYPSQPCCSFLRCSIFHQISSSNQHLLNRKNVLCFSFTTPFNWDSPLLLCLLHLFISKKKVKCKQYIFNKTTNTRSSLKPTNNSTIIFLLYLLSIIFCFYFNSFYLITTINYSTIKTTTFDFCLFDQFQFNQFIILKTCFFLNQQKNKYITVIFFFFSKTFNSKNKFISTKNNQPINHKTNTIQKSLSIKKIANSATAAFSHTHTTSYLCYDLSTINTITQQGVISTI
jgi:hypothetical protein